MLPHTQPSQGVYQLQWSQYIHGIALAIYIYDYFLTLPQEVELVWASRWTLMKFIFLLDRYFIIPNLVMQMFLVGIVGRDLDVDCKGLAKVIVYVAVVGIFVSETILCLRLWVMWDNDKRILVGVVSLFAASAIFQSSFCAKFFGSNAYDFYTLGEIHGCVFKAQLENGYFTCIVVLVLDTTILLLALIPTIRMYISEPRTLGRRSLMHRVYREGVLFYVYLCAYSALALGVIIQSASNTFMLLPPFLVIRVILSTRMIIHIRRLYAAESAPTSVSGHWATSVLV